MRQVSKKGLLTVAAASGVLAVTGGYAHADTGAEGVAAHSPGVASGNTVQVPVHAPVNVCGNTVNVVGLLNSASGNTCINGGGHFHRGHEGHKGHGSKGHEGREGHEGHGHGTGVALAAGKAEHSPGIVSGNVVQVPVSVPVNDCGNNVSVVGVGNTATGNGCFNDGGGDHEQGGPWEHEPSRHHGQPPSDDCDDHGPHHPGHGQHHGNPPSEGGQPGHQQPAQHQPGGNAPGAPGTHEVKPVTAVKGVHRAPEQPSTMAQAGTKAAQLAHTGAGQVGMAGAASAALLLGGAVLYRRSRDAQG